MPKKKKRSRTVIVGDIHAGSTVSPWMPEVLLADGGKYQLNVFQHWLNQCWAIAEKEIIDLAPDIVIFNGDVIQGGHPKDAQLVTNIPALQSESALVQLANICDKAKKKYFVKGTPWHEGMLSSDIESLAQQLGGERNPDTGQFTWPELFLDLGKQYVAHFAHSIGVTSIPQNEASMPLRDLLNLMQEMQRFYNSRPNVRCVVRSHRHRCVIAQAPPDLVAMVSPGWQLKGEFVYKKQPGSIAQIGYTWLDFDGDRAYPYYRVFDPPALRIEKAI